MTRKTKYRPIIILLFLLSVFVVFRFSIFRNPSRSEPRIFKTSFESLEDFQDFYMTPQGDAGTSHALSPEQVQTGNFSHKAWILEPNQPSTTFKNNNHRGYPTIQFDKTSGGAFRCPCEMTLWVWVDGDLKSRMPENEWLSFATFTSDETDAWARTVLVNLSYDGFVHLMHVPNQGESERIFQTSLVRFPMRQWVELRIFLDLDPRSGLAKVWQDGVLVSSARVRGGNGKLAQAHFGLYAAPSVSDLVVYNDDLTIRERVEEESEDQQ